MTSLKASTLPFDLLAEPARVIGSVSLRAKLATGRRTVAYLGFRAESGQPVVVREVKEGVDPDTFTLEMEYAGALRIGTPIEPTIEHAGRTYAICPAIAGESLGTILDHALATKRPVPLDIAIAIASGIASALELLGKDRTHGDLVPEHVLVGYDGTVHVIDPAGEAHQERMTAKSRAGYRSPEHVKGKPLSPASDLFAVGILLYEMTTAHRLFGDGPDVDQRIAASPPPRPKDLVEGTYPIELQLIVRKLLRPIDRGRLDDVAVARDALSVVSIAHREATREDVAVWLQQAFPARFAAWRKLVGSDALPAIQKPMSGPDTPLDQAMREVARDVAAEVALVLEAEELESSPGLADLEDSLAQQFLPQPKLARAPIAPPPPVAAAAPSVPTPPKPPPMKPAPSLGLSKPPLEHREEPRPTAPAESTPSARPEGERAPSVMDATRDRRSAIAASLRQDRDLAPSAPQTEEKRKEAEASPTPGRSIPSSPPPSPAPVLASTPTAPLPSPSDVSPVKPAQPVREPSAAPSPRPAREARPVIPTDTAKETQRLMVMAAIVLLVVLIAGGLFLSLQTTRESPAPTATRVLVSVIPQNATITVLGKSYTSETYVEVQDRDVEITASAPGYKTQTITARAGRTDKMVIVLTRQNK